MSEDCRIIPMKIWQSRQVARLFDHGLNSDFAYFPADYLAVTRQKNSAARLAVANLRSQRSILTASIGSDLAGYAISNTDPDGVHFLFWLYVHPDFRGKAIGRKLVDGVVAKAKQSHSHTLRLATHRHVDFYKKLGFLQDEPLNFAIGPINMIIMEKSLV